MNRQMIFESGSTGRHKRHAWWGAPLLVGSLILATNAAAATATSGILSAGTHDIYYRGEMLSEGGMSELRGGFRMAGMELNFGAKLTSDINDRVRYITQVAFDNAGARVLSRTLEQSATTGIDVTPVSPNPGSASAAGNAVESAVKGGINAADIAGALNLDGLSDFSGVLVSDPAGGGMTAALHNITRNAIISSLSTTASGQSISNKIDVSVNVLNFREIRASRQRAMILNSLQGIPR
ncbi:hypothetical protein [Halomonas getboli]|uniref:hypothetical protein n=1 Tax=Halomonas getboli TaxID=2935862 RepID=UPI001FFE55BD|nr:hypothetical protein [Halomonas getboli]MCK2185026.1 hypothetical protein [Halomonas getboli]